MKYSFEKIYSIFLNHVISTDSRTAKRGQLFIALKGPNFNGNKYATQALLKGCEYAIVDDVNVCRSNQYILVDNCLKTLQLLANHHRKTLNIPILAITGSNGKTTTKELLKSVLNKKFNTFATSSNFNNNIGVPLSLLSINSSKKFGIIEMGANHIGEIEELCEITEPNYGIITNVGNAHLKGFGSFEGVKKAKSELYKYIYKSKGMLFVNRSNDHLISMLPGGVEVIYYDETLFKDFSFIINPFLELSFSINAKKFFIKTNLIGDYNVENILTAICVGQYFNISMDEIKNAIEQYVPENWRSQLKKTDKNTLILDNYNANPVSMALSINNFDNIKTNKKKLVILGDMLELGEYSKGEHQEIIDLLSQKKFHKVMLVGENFYQFSPHTDFHHFKNVENLTQYISNKDFINQYILIKSSRSLQLEKIVQYL